MGYYFECPYCNRVEPVNYPSEELHANCEACGEDTCVFCNVGGMCDECWLEEDAENLQDEV